jgi:hypothetical protein
LQWLHSYEAAQSSVDNRHEAIETAAAQIEHSLQIPGATAGRAGRDGKPDACLRRAAILPHQLFYQSPIGSKLRARQTFTEQCILVAPTSPTPAHHVHTDNHTRSDASTPQRRSTPPQQRPSPPPQPIFMQPVREIYVLLKMTPTGVYRRSSRPACLLQGRQGHQCPGFIKPLPLVCSPYVKSTYLLLKMTPTDTYCRTSRCHLPTPGPSRQPVSRIHQTLATGMQPVRGIYVVLMMTPTNNLL